MPLGLRLQWIELEAAGWDQEFYEILHMMRALVEFRGETNSVVE